MMNDANEKRSQYDQEYKRYGNTVIDTVNNVKFTQGFHGYDTAQVDEFLDDIIKLVRTHREFQTIGTMIETSAIGNTRFIKGFRGYDAGEVGNFLREIVRLLEGLNKIKGTYKDLGGNTFAGTSRIKSTEIKIDEIATPKFNDENKNLEDAIIDTINDVKFTQGFKGYYTGDVDEFLEDIIRQVKTNGAVETRSITSARFTKGFRGYDVGEVDRFLGEIRKMVELG